MANIGQPVKIHEVEPLEEPCQPSWEPQKQEEETPEYAPVYRED